MSRQANPSAIGAFVVGAVMLVVAAIMIFGTGHFFSERQNYVLYFEGSVKGLNVGAPVNFRGVRIGTVTDLQILVRTVDLTFLIPVLIEIDPGRFRAVGGGTGRLLKGDAEQEALMGRLIDRGLRAQLKVQSLVTGQLMVEFDFYPDKPLNLVGIAGDHRELPTIPSDLQELERTMDKVIAAFKDIPLDELVAKVGSIADGVDRLVNAPELAEGMRNLNGTLVDVRRLARNLDGRVGPLAERLEKTAEAAGTVLAQAERTLAGLEGTVSEDSALHHELVTAARELGTAARSVKELADYLERHPDALLRGKLPTGGK